MTNAPAHDIAFFHTFMISVFAFMPCTKYIPRLLMRTANKTLERKLNQYTNWNLVMIGCHHVLYKYFNIDNVYISRFLALNSLQIFLIYHAFVIYDSRILFDILDNGKPFLLNIGAYHNTMIKVEYFIINFFIHILPAYTYKDYILQSGDMNIYTILFKFMWALNVFGNFDVISIYLPSFNFCSVKLFNMILLFDYGLGMLLGQNKNDLIFLADGKN